MLSEGIAPRLTACHADCGRLVEYKFSPRVFCSECRVEKRREMYRRAAEVQRRKRGVEPVKGTTAACTRCATAYTKRSVRGLYCDPCKVAVPRERAREVSRAKTGVPGSRAYHARWYKAKRHADPRYAINFRFRAAIRRVLQGGKRGRSWEALVGYTLADLLAHLERQFLPGMTWDNRGKWHIDHIVPLASFDFEKPDCEGFKAAWALTNLRPLWARDNVRKNAKRTHLI